MYAQSIGRSQDSCQTKQNILSGLASKGSLFQNLFEQPQEKTNKMACAPSEDSDQSLPSA